MEEKIIKLTPQKLDRILYGKPSCDIKDERDMQEVLNTKAEDLRELYSKLQEMDLESYTLGDIINLVDYIANNNDYTNKADVRTVKREYQLIINRLLNLISCFGLNGFCEEWLEEIKEDLDQLNNFYSKGE